MSMTGGQATEKRHIVQGGAGLRLHVREWGKEDGPPVLFIHGWSQNHLCWAMQYESELASEFRLVAYDLGATACPRRHSSPSTTQTARSGPTTLRPSSASCSSSGQCSSVGHTARSSSATTLRAYGAEGIGAVEFVEGAVKLGEAAFGTLIGPGFLDHFADATADDLPTNIWAMRAFVRACLSKPVPADVFETALCWNIAVPARDPRQPRRPRDRRRRRPPRRSRCRCSSPRAAPTSSCSRRWPSTSSRRVRRPRPPGTTASATSPHLEEPERFNRELAGFVRQVRQVTVRA